MNFFKNLHATSDFGPWELVTEESLSVAVVALGIGVILYAAIKLALYRLAKKEAVLAILLKALIKPALWSILLVTIIQMVEIIEKHFQVLAQYNAWIAPIKKIVILLALWWIAYGWIGTACELYIRKRKAAKYKRAQYEYLYVVKKLGRASMTIILALLILSNLGFEIATVLAFGGIGGLAMGYASKDIVSNILAGIMLQMTHPFHETDSIEILGKSISGTVEDMDWYYTKIVDTNGKPTLVPNSMFSSLPVRNDSKG